MVQVRLVAKTMRFSLGVVVSCCLGLCVGEGERRYFDCYKDKCERGTQHCVHVEREWRCFHCQDMAASCGRSEMPRDCDSFCVGLELHRTQHRLNATVQETHQLLETLYQVNVSHNTAEQRIEQLQDEIRRLKLRQDETEEKLNSSRETFIDLQQNHTNLQMISTQMMAKHSINGCDNHISLPLVILLISLIVVLVLLLSVTCLKEKLLKIIKGQNKKEVIAEIPLGRQNEETKVLMPQDDAGKMNRSGSDDSAVNLSGDNESDNSDEGNDNKDNVDDNCDITNDQGDFEVDGPTRCKHGLKSHKDNCVKRDTPAALKGIQPTVASSSRNNLNQKMYS